MSLKSMSLKRFNYEQKGILKHLAIYLTSGVLQLHSKAVTRHSSIHHGLA